MKRVGRLIAVMFVAGGLTGAILAVAVAGARRAPAGTADDLVALKAAFARPARVPFPADNPFTEAKRRLGDRLFHDPGLSVDGSLSCASCHDRSRGFADGRVRGSGVPGRALARHTPTLWNLAFAANVFWDGRARSLEEQVAGPIESRDEMAMPMPELVARLAADKTMADAFAAAFPDRPRVDRVNLAKALATYERTLISPLTRFDRWVDGDSAALTPAEVRGFRLFTGKAGCAACHSGFAFTDNAFHDIGLPGEDRGRGAVLQLAKVDHAFKTPGLREIGRSAPYMHDGSLKTLEAVLDHYELGVVQRPTLSSDLPRRLALSAAERSDLIAFLGTLTSQADPQPLTPIVPRSDGPRTAARHVQTVTQDNKAFRPKHVSLVAGHRLWIVNNDTRTHNVRVFDPKLNFDSGAQDPGETVQIKFPKAGRYLVYCGIHPKMELFVEVTPTATKGAALGQP